MAKRRCRTALGAALVALALGAALPSGGDETPPLGHKRTAWESPSVRDHRAEVFRFGDEYIGFLGRHKTEREVIGAAAEAARKAGFHEPRGKGAHAGDKLLFEEHGKILALAVVGRRPIGEGLRVVAAHVDTVRIDLKQNPIYADANLALLQTHYYGNLKKYQWLSLPLELRGVVVRKDGKKIELRLGAEPRDPVLVIPDVLAHLSHEVDREEGEQVPGESLDPVVGSMPAPAGGAAGRDPFEAGVLKLLGERYGLEADDLRAAELELVPAQAPRSVGLDQGLVGGYGQDGRAGAYAALRAILSMGTPQHTALLLLVDKQEIGATGNTSAGSNFLPRVVGELVRAAEPGATELRTAQVLSRSLALAANATSSAHPLYRSLWEKRNASFLGSGPSWDQKGAHAEVMAHLRGLLDREKIAYQTGAFSKTLGARVEEESLLPLLTTLGMDGVDLAIPVMSMHAPFELASKADLFEGMRAYRAWLSD